MSKRELEPADTDRPPKRPRQEHKLNVQEIRYARELQELLTFRQDGVQQLRDGIASFKAFLEGILYHRDEDNWARQLSILREYLESQKPPASQDVERPFLHQLWQAWSFADQNNHDVLVSSISSILAQLLKTLSSLLDFREHGKLLCRTILQNQHLRFIKRCLAAPVHKEFIISPSIRLLTEVTVFDGGVFAREVYKRRDQTFDAGVFRRNLGLLKTDIPVEEQQRRPSIRTLALRYILAQLKYLHEGGKADILRNRPLCIALFAQISNDPPDLVTELLATTEQHVLKDGDVPRMSKANLLSQQCLERVTDIATQSDDQHPASAKAFTWLHNVCTISSYGILRHGGWYPPGTSTLESSRKEGFIDLGLDSLDFYDRGARLDIRNTTLLAWTQTLRPHSNLKERELLLTCFRAAPELVAAYFAEKPMQMDPKLSNTWIGYASLLFEVIRLPLPEFLGGEDGWADIPPQSEILMENVLPSPLPRKLTTRCLNQSSELITFFAIQVLVVAFQKLDQVLQILRSRSNVENGSLWEQAAERTKQSFIDRCPTMKDVINVFRQIPDDDRRAMQREAIARLVRLFYEVTPLQALEEQFDISSPLTSALTRAGEQAEHAATEISSLRMLELEHMLFIARHGLGMRWFHKQGALQYSPIVALLRLHMQELHNMQIRQLIEHVLMENNVLSGRADAAASPVDALVASLAGMPQNNSVWGFVDDCIARASRQPIKYVDQIEAVQERVGVDDCLPIPSPLAAVVVEQAAFVAGKAADEKKQQMGFVNRLMDLFEQTTQQQHRTTIAALREQIVLIKGWRRKSRQPDVIPEIEAVKISSSVEAVSNGNSAAVEDEHVLELPYEAPSPEPTSHPELFRWAQKELETALDDGDIGALMLCLCSQHTDIRLQARAQLMKLALQLSADSPNDDARQMSLLIGELCETFEQQCMPNSTALPYLAGTFAVRALQVQRQPAHCMYPKLNEYLIRGPEWRLRRLPSYWLSKTVLGMPADDDAFWREVDWVIEWLVDGLRTPQDLDILRRCHAFERVMALWSSPGTAGQRQVRDRILELLYRATCIDGGSSTLVTRVGALSWLDMLVGGGGTSTSTSMSTKNPSAISAALRRRIADTVTERKSV